MSDKTLVKGLSILTALAQGGGGGCAVGRLSEQLGLSKSNTHRLLNTLVSQGFAVQDGPKGHYRASTRIWELGRNVIAKLDYVSVARPVMRDLVATLGETVHLSKLDGAEVVYLEKFDGTHPVRAYTQVGGRAPAYCVATGKIQLAYKPDHELASLLADLHPHTPMTIADTEALRADLRAARADGIAYNLGEWRSDVAGAASPVRDASGEVIAAIGISGPASRLTRTRLADYGAAVRAAAETISGRLGGP